MGSRFVEEYAVVIQQMRFAALALHGAVIFTALLAGCKQAKPEIAPPKPPEVSYVFPTQDMVRDYEDFTGRTEAVESTVVMPQVTGRLTKAYFAEIGKEGVDVVKGEPLFEIDPRQFEAELERAKATVAQTEGVLLQKEQALARAKALRVKGTNTPEDLETAQADEVVAKANRDLAIANRKLAELNFDYCHIVAPISGRISRKMIDVGNQVTAYLTQLTTIRTLEPMHANFDVDERTILRLRRLLQSGELMSARNTRRKLSVGLADEENFSLTGIINFTENQIDPGTGTLRVRIVIENPNTAELIGPAFDATKAIAEQITTVHISLPSPDLRMLSPNMFVRVRFWIGQAKQAILVPEAALVSDQGIRHLFVVNEENKVEYRPVEIGLQQGGMRVIKNGVTTKDRVIVSGLQRVRANILVTATEQKKATSTKVAKETVSAH